jgi:hypothetical protein
MNQNRSKSVVFMFMLVDALSKDMLFYRIVGVASTAGQADCEAPGSV